MDVVDSETRMSPAKWERRTIAKLISEAEECPIKAREIINSILPFTGRAYIIGITGPPGCGKSTLIEKLALQIRKKGKRVGIIAIDPSSTSSGGAFMGNRVRMREASKDSGIFIRSMASRGSLGGLSLATPTAVKVLDAAGIDYIIIETVGAGQMQTEISKTAHTVIIVLQPESGDIIQAMKSGLMEIGDIFAVNKSDLRNAIKTENDLAEVLSMIHTDKWTPRIVKTVATKGRGIAALASCIEEHRRYLASSGEMLNKQNEIARYEVEKLLEYEVKKMVAKKLEGIKVQSIIQDVIAKRISAYDAAMKLMDEINEG